MYSNAHVTGNGDAWGWRLEIACKRTTAVLEIPAAVQLVTPGTGHLLLEGQAKAHGLPAGEGGSPEGLALWGQAWHLMLLTAAVRLKAGSWYPQFGFIIAIFAISKI